MAKSRMIGVNRKRPETPPTGQGDLEHELAVTKDTLILLVKYNHISVTWLEIEQELPYVV